MKLLVSILLALTASASFAESQPAPNPLRFYIGLGPTMAAAPQVLRDDHKTGFHIVPILGYSLCTSLEMMGRMELQFIPVDAEERFGSNVYFDGGGIDVLMFGIDARLSVRRPQAAVRPFLIGGGGVSRMSQSDILTDLAYEQYAPLLIDSQNGFYYNFGAGVTVRAMTNLTGFIMIRYLEFGLDYDNWKFLPITLGVQF